MRVRLREGIGIALIVCWALPGTGTAQVRGAGAVPGVSAPAASVGEARPVEAWTRFCAHFPRECAVDPAEPAMVRLTPELWRTLVSINRKVNADIAPVTDLEHLGVLDSWDFPSGGYGDCEDYQLLKRRLLVEAGLPRRALRMTVVIDEKREGHAVLMVRTDRGDFILDNKTDTILPWHQTGYVYVKREGHDSQTWVSLGGVTSPVVTANR